MNTKPQTYTLEGKHLARLAARDGITIRGAEDAQRAYVRIAGWIGGDGVGCWPSDFFDECEEYKGPDDNGLEPKWEDAPVVEYRVPLIEHAPALLHTLEILLTWGRNYTSPVERNSPHALLCAAHDLIERARGRK